MKTYQLEVPARGQITITAPLAAVGDEVKVLNYRMRPATWEHGEVRAVTYRPAYEIKRHDGSSHTVRESWSYEVWITRPVKEDHYKRWGGGYSITVRDDSIRRAPFIPEDFGDGPGTTRCVECSREIPEDETDSAPYCGGCYRRLTAEGFFGL